MLKSRLRVLKLHKLSCFKTSQRHGSAGACSDFSIYNSLLQAYKILQANTVDAPY
ncbi:hypothetical protein HMPREF9554_02055 [Treponema phagedenis F0421]|nr:hypothetical protein HMPREF9554_02055 [Treponema phagedenis F0421]